MQYLLEIKGQPPKHGRSGFGGPDTYVAVQEVPKGASPLKALNASVAKKRGIRIRYFGEGYSKNRGPNSKLGRAIAEARAYIRSKPHRAA